MDLDLAVTDQREELIAILRGTQTRRQRLSLMVMGQVPAGKVLEYRAVSISEGPPWPRPLAER